MALCEAHKWGPYEREAVVIPKRKFRVDFLFRDYRLAVEIDGIGGKRSAHTTPTGVSNDREKDALLQLNGWHVLRFTTHHFKKNAAYVIHMMNEAIARWRNDDERV